MNSLNKYLYYRMSRKIDESKMFKTNYILIWVKVVIEISCINFLLKYNPNKFYSIFYEYENKFSIYIFKDSHAKIYN